MNKEELLKSELIAPLNVESLDDCLMRLHDSMNDLQILQAGVENLNSINLPPHVHMKRKEAAPKSGQLFLGDFGEYNLLLTSWDRISCGWVTAEFIDDTAVFSSGFKNRFRSEDEMKGWTYLPKKRGRYHG